MEEERKDLQENTSEDSDMVKEQESCAEQEAQENAEQEAAEEVPAEEDSILREINIPAAQLSAGYLSNGEERDLLRQEAYLEKVAEGVIDAIEEACERLSQ